MSTKALILVGGGTRGTRFRPLSLDTPKVLFPVGGKPILSHAVDAVAALKDVKEVLLVGFYEDSVFSQFIADTNKQYPHLSIKYLREYKAMGTAGGLYHFRDVILKGNPSRFFVIHADVCCSFPLKEIEEFYEEKKAKYVIFGTTVPAAVANNFGAIVTDPETQRVIHYVEKPESHISNLINAGVYLFDQTIFDTIAAAKKVREEKAQDPSFVGEGDEDHLRLEQDILVQLPATDSFYVYETKDFWRQIKTAGSAVPANALYLQQAFQADPKQPGLQAPSANIVPPVYIDISAKVDPTAKLGPNVSIGPHAVIAAGARVKDSIVLEGVEVKHDAAVFHSILGRGCKIGSWARIEGSAVAPNDHSETLVKDGAKIQSVTILSSDVNVAEEVHVQNTIVLPHKDIKNDVVNEVIM